MHVRFWGVRGSIPAPVTGEEVAARLVEMLLHLGRAPDAPDLRDRATVSRWVAGLPPALGAFTGGNTPCVQMTTRGGELFIIDCGTGLRALGEALMCGVFGRGQGRARLFLSHLHWDHIQGWPFFRPAYVAGNQFDLYARHEKVESHLKRQQEEPFFPPAAWDEMRAELRCHTLNEHPIALCDGQVRVSSLELSHPSRAFAFRFEADGRAFVYASDGAFPDPRSEEARAVVEFFRDADLLVFDSQFTHEESLRKPDWGHSSALTGVELACRAGAKKLALFHHAPDASEAHLEALWQTGRDYARSFAPERAVEVLLAREGLELGL